MKQTLLHNRHLQVCAALIAADCLVFTMVNPREASAAWLIVGYVLLGLTLFGLAGLATSAFKNYSPPAQRVGKRLLRYAAAIIVVLIGLQSVGQLTIRDIITLLPLALLAYGYFGYGKKTIPELP